MTVPSIDVGKTIGHGLVKNKLAACVNVIPQITSIYEWKNEINEDNEVTLALFRIKNSKAQYNTQCSFFNSSKS